MWSKIYRGYAIHGHCDRNAVRVHAPDCSFVRECASLPAARAFIRKRIRAEGSK